MVSEGRRSTGTLASAPRWEDLLQPFGDHVAVALQREDEAVGKDALGAGRDRRRAAVEGLRTSTSMIAGKAV